MPLKPERVITFYGLPHRPAGFYQAKQNHFPFANFIALGGCTIREEIYTDIEYCDACRTELKKWNTARGTMFEMPPGDIDEFIRLHQRIIQQITQKRGKLFTKKD